MEGFKLYEHIRLGAMLRPQETGGALFHAGRSCALGAALESSGTRFDDSGVNEEALYDELDRFPFAHAIVDGHEVWCEIFMRNDDNWTREAIADWLEPIEEAWWREQEAQEAARHAEAERRLAANST